MLTYPAVSRIITLVLRLTGCIRQFVVLKAPLITSGTLPLRVIRVRVVKLGMPNRGPLTSLIQSVPAPLLTVRWKALVLLFLISPILTFKCGSAIPNRPQALLQRQSAVITPLFVRVRASRVKNRVVRLSVAVSVVILFLKVVTCPLNMLAAGPTTWAQTPLNLRRVNSCVLRLVLLKAQEAARQTGIAWVPALGVGVRFVRTRRALQ